MSSNFFYINKIDLAPITHSKYVIRSSESHVSHLQCDMWIAIQVFFFQFIMWILFRPILSIHIIWRLLKIKKISTTIGMEYWVLTWVARLLPSTSLFPTNVPLKYNYSTIYWEWHSKIKILQRWEQGYACYA